ncbi:hydroxyacid dehydrogenase [uncultured Alsobacter sp.]|uniref:hydroxyacid dehydrogenase n=1 Tax=uncultured Alsobacter sp. TaxID=1748258 RepID=UPI0025F8B2CF|nr:hydroxyacid dehydrogenase [uncultured Alsobacter sp.]
MTDCLIVQPIADVGLDLLRAAGLTLHVCDDRNLAAMAPHLATAIAVVTRDAGLSAEAIAIAPCLKVIGVHGTGTTAVAKDAAAARGIAVVNTPGANAQSVAELAIGLMLACARRLTEADRAVRSGDFGWRYRQESFELQGRTLGVVGFGHIAKRVAALGRAFGMEVIGWSSRANPADMAAEGIRPVQELDELCARSDVLTLHALPGPKPLFDAALFARVKPGAILVNTGRGALIDEAALTDALTSGQLGAAGLDVFAVEPLPADSALLGAPNLVLAPHVGGATADALDRTAKDVARKVLAVLDRSPAEEPR